MEEVCEQMNGCGDDQATLSKAHSLSFDLQDTAQLQQLAADAAVPLHLQSADVLALIDKSLPTMMGLAGWHMSSNFSLRMGIAYASSHC